MPRYVKNDRTIFASERAYKAIYEAQGFLPVENKKPVQEQGNEAPAQENKEEHEEEEDQDDYSGDAEDQNQGEENKEESAGSKLDPNGAMPLTAQVGLLSYEDLKAEAKRLGIPKYSNTKAEALRELVIEALEAENDK